VASRNAQIVESAFLAFNEGGTDALVPFVDPEGEFTTPPELASEPDTYRGHEGLRRYFDSFFEVMDEIRIEPLAVRERGEAVVMEFRLRARGKATGIEAEQLAYAAAELRDERIVSLTVHPTLADAEARADAAGKPTGS
jgi:ketosteroid isomerase-like protein